MEFPSAYTDSLWVLWIDGWMDGLTDTFIVDNPY